MSERILMFLVVCGMASGWLLRVEAEPRVGGSASLVAEVLSGGGIANATNGLHTLRGSFGQNGFSEHSASNSTTVLRSGFWKPDTACELYPTFITQISQVTNSVAIEFNVMKSNTYTVVYVNEAPGGLLAGLGVWTNEVASPFVFSGTNATAVVIDNLNGIFDLSRFYRVWCR